MSRSGYHDDLDNWDLIKWRGRVASAIRGKRGQKMLTDLLAALDAMPEKSLIVHELETAEGEVCALGALMKARGINMSKIDPDEPDEVADALDIAPCLAQEIVYANDEVFDSRFNPGTRQYVDVTPEERWAGMRAWVASKITPSHLPGRETPKLIDPAPGAPESK
jgi:hypothetical protein